MRALYVYYCEHNNNLLAERKNISLSLSPKQKTNTKIPYNDDDFILYVKIFYSSGAVTLRNQLKHPRNLIEIIGQYKFILNHSVKLNLIADMPTFTSSLTAESSWQSLTKSLHRLDIGYEDLVSVTRLRQGKPDACCRLVRLLLFEISREVTYQMALLGVGFGDSDIKLIQRLFRYLRDQSCYSPKMLPAEFLRQV